MNNEQGRKLKNAERIFYFYNKVVTQKSQCNGKTKITNLYFN